MACNLTTIVRNTDPQLPVAAIRPLEEVIGASVAAQRFMMLLMSGFAAMALLLTAIGIYGALSYQVRRRNHEIGLRMALGANPRDVLKLVVGEGMAVALTGIIIGLIGSFVLTRLMAQLLYGVAAADPLTFALTALLIAAVTLLACIIPARRAMRVDPMVALRYE